MAASTGAWRRRHSRRDAARAAVPARRAAGVHSTRRDGRRMEFEQPASARTCRSVLDLLIARTQPPETRLTWPGAPCARRCLCRSSTRAACSLSKSERRAFPNGREHEVAIVRHPPSVVLIPMQDDGRVILIRQYRASVDRACGSCRPGSLDPGETPEDAAARECEEEIGLVPRHVERLRGLFPTPGFCDEELIFFRVSDLRAPAARLDAPAGRGRRHPSAAVDGRRSEGDGRAGRHHRSEDGLWADADLTPDGLTPPCRPYMRTC